MAIDTYKLLRNGCIVCVVLVVVTVVVVGVGGYVFVKQTIHGFKEVEAASQEVTDRFGQATDYRPDASGAIAGERIEVFLQVRDSMSQARQETERTFALLGKHESPSPTQIVAMIRAGIDLVPQLAEFFSNRNQALLEQEMGLGEYTYIYAIAYFAWLEMSPADGPPFVLVGDDGNHGHSDDPREVHLEANLSSLNRLLLPMLRHQLEDLQDQDQAPAGWQEALTAEIAAMAADRFHIPWQDGLPQVMAESLVPYRERLSSSYSPLCNPLEVQANHDG
jgi:hypothetical protein